MLSDAANARLGQWIAGFVSHYRAHMAGFVFAVFVGHIFIYIVVQGLWRATVSKESCDRFHKHPWHAGLVGITERALYFFAVGLFPSVIGFWLAIKVAGGWKRYANSSEGQDSAEPEGKVLFNTFLIGNALSVLYAATGYKMVEWWRFTDEYRFADPSVGVAAPLLLVIGSLVLWLYVSHKTDRREGKPKKP